MATKKKSQDDTKKKQELTPEQIAADDEVRATDTTVNWDDYPRN